jgi:hypothetical protein
VRFAQGANLHRRGCSAGKDSKIPPQAPEHGQVPVDLTHRLVRHQHWAGLTLILIQRPPSGPPSPFCWRHHKLGELHRRSPPSFLSNTSISTVSLPSIPPATSYVARLFPCPARILPWPPPRRRLLRHLVVSAGHRAVPAIWVQPLGEVGAIRVADGPFHHAPRLPDSSFAGCTKAKTANPESDPQG